MDLNFENEYGLYDPEDDTFQKIWQDARELGEMPFREKVERLELTPEDIYYHVRFGQSIDSIMATAKKLFTTRNARHKPSTEKRRLVRLERKDIVIYLTSKYPTGMTFCVLDATLGPLEYQPNPTKVHKKDITKPDIVDNSVYKILVEIMIKAWSNRVNLSEDEILYNLICDKVIVNDHLSFILSNYPEEVGIIHKAIERGDIKFPKGVRNVE